MNKPIDMDRIYGFENAAENAGGVKAAEQSASRSKTEAAEHKSTENSNIIKDKNLSGAYNYGLNTSASDIINGMSGQHTGAGMAQGNIFPDMSTQGTFFTPVYNAGIPKAAGYDSVGYNTGIGGLYGSSGCLQCCGRGFADGGGQEIIRLLQTQLGRAVEIELLYGNRLQKKSGYLAAVSGNTAAVRDKDSKNLMLFSTDDIKLITLLDE